MSLVSCKITYHGNLNIQITVLEDIFSCDNKGKTCMKNNDSTTNQVVESNLEKLEDQLNTTNAIAKIILYKNNRCIN